MTAVSEPTTASYDFEAAVCRLRPRLQRYAARRLGDQHEAEELAQEALLRACNRHLNTEDELAAWCHVVTSRLVLDRLRVRGRTVSVAEPPEGDRSQRDTADFVVARDEARTALDALDALPARQAAVLWAREVEGASYAELGQRFGMTDPAVRSVLMRARRALRSEYAARGGTLPHAGLAIIAPWAALKGLSALHRVATKGTAVGVTAVGVTALGGLLLLPPSAAGALPPATQADRVTAHTTTIDSLDPSRLASSPARVATTRPAPPRVTDTTVGRTALAPLARTCGVQARGAGVGGSDCAPKSSTTSVSLAVPVHAGPVGVREVAVRTNDYDCTGFVTNPVLTCRPGDTS